jgi:carboxymethylenebutenolidase
MCHDDDSRAPAPPVRGEVAARGGLTLTSADGTVLSAYEATPAGFGQGGPGMVVLPDVRGLHPYYKDLTERFAEAGIAAVAIDYFGRTAGTTDRGDDFEHMPHVQQVDPANVRRDVAAAMERLRTTAGDLDLAGVIGFYGRPVLVNDVVDQMHIPMLLQIAGADQATSQEEFAEFERRLSAQGVEHDMKVYDGAPHSFFDRAFAEWKDAGADSWRRMLDFVAGHSELRAPA